MDNYGFNPQMQQFMGTSRQASAMQQLFANPSQAMQKIMQRNMQEMVSQQLADWQAQHPEEYSRLAEQFSGKNREQQVKMLRNMAKKCNFPLDQYAMQFGIAL